MTLIAGNSHILILRDIIHLSDNPELYNLS